MISRPLNGFKTPVNRSARALPAAMKACHGISRGAQIVKVIGHIYRNHCQPGACQDALRRGFQKENFFLLSLFVILTT
jgi:hypothetical protein